MNLKLKTLVVAIAMAAAGTAQAAAINTDGFSGGNGIGAGTGAGDLFLSIYDASRSQSLTLNLNLTANDFRNNNAALMNTFSVQDTLLQSFIAITAGPRLSTPALRRQGASLAQCRRSVVPPMEEARHRVGRRGCSRGPVSGR